MCSDDELLRLAGDGVSPWERIWVAHYFSFFESTAEQRESLRNELLAAGMGAAPGEIGTDEEITGDGYWHLWAFTQLKANRDALLAANRRASEIAEENGVRYDEWRVMREPSTGKPRQVP